jgi:polyisoprenoid-binding protein YceI
MKMIPWTCCLLAVIFAPAAVQAETYAVDPVHTSAVFNVTHLGLAPVYGRFNDVSGTIDFDPENLDAATVVMTVKTQSVDTANEKRDEHLRSDDFLDVGTYPEMTFKSTEWKKLSDNKFEVAGEFTLMDTTKTITVPVTYFGASKGMQGETRAGWKTSFTIKRSEYGMDQMIGPVGDEVEITLAVEGIVKEEAASAEEEGEDA